MLSPSPVCLSTAGIETMDSTAAQILKAFMCWKKFGDDAQKKTAAIAMEINMHERSKSFLQALKNLTADGFLAKDGGTYGLTDTGVAAGVEEFGEELGQPMTNADFQEQIKASLKLKYAPLIFDLLLQRGPTSRKELARILGVNDRSHGFSYGLQELTKTRGLVAPDPSSGGQSKALCLTDKAFLKGAARNGEKSDPEDVVEMTSESEDASEDTTLEH
jgi:Mn-dependent DtxR family transcriptional regulator